MKRFLIFSGPRSADTPALRPLALRRELVWTLLLKLAVLLLLKQVFFAHRVPADSAQLGMAERMSQPQGLTPAAHQPDGELRPFFKESQ